MRRAKVLVHDIPAGFLEEVERERHYRFTYLESYDGPPVSLEMPVEGKIYDYDGFPPFFDGLLPEGVMLEALLKKSKLDRRDYFSQLLVVGQDLVGCTTVEEA